MDSAHVHSGLETLSDAHHRREIELARHSNVRAAESDDEADRECPIFDSFYEADGNEGVLKMTNFTTAEFRGLYGRLHGHVVTHWNVGRGRKSAVKPMDAFFMLLTVLKHADVCSMTHLQEQGNTFKNYKYAVEAIDVTFQQTNRPFGNMAEGKKYFSGKHKLYGYKVEVSVRPNGLAAAYSKHYPGSVSDITILTKRMEEHKWRLEKSEEDKDISD
eukprot:IDg22852t1